MNHDEIESLLGAFAVDAVEPEEAEEIEHHILQCPRCREEVTSHREVAALLGSGRAEVPPEVWGRVAAAIAPGAGTGPEETLDTVRPIVLHDPKGRRQRRRWLASASGLVGAVACTALVLLGLEVGHLNDEVHSIAAENGLSSAVTNALVADHQEVTLTGINTSDDAKVVIAPDRDAYWVSSDLPLLPSSETYQVWSAVGSKVVSIEVLGADPTRLAAFRIAPSVQRIMVTVEPAGGSPAPTAPVLVQAPVTD